MVATFVKRSRKIWNVNDGIKKNKKNKKKQTNFVKMLFSRNDTIILILLQNRVNLIND